VVPPHRRDEDGVAGFQLGHLGVPQRLAEAREAVVVGRREVDQADGLAGRVEVERADVQVRQLLRREQREAAAAGRHHRQVVRQVVVGGDAGLVADPDAGQRVAGAEVDVVVAAQAGQDGVDGGRADVDGGRARIVAVALHLVEHGVQARARRVVIEAGQVLVVEEAAADLGFAQHRAHGGALVEAAQVGVGGIDRGAGGVDQRPVRRQAAHDVGLGGAQQLIVRQLAPRSQLADGLIDGQHRCRTRRFLRSIRLRNCDSEATAM
jgi:hypothetical protein